MCQIKIRRAYSIECWAIVSAILYLPYILLGVSQRVVLERFTFKCQVIMGNEKAIPNETKAKAAVHIARQPPPLTAYNNNRQPTETLPQQKHKQQQKHNKRIKMFVMLLLFLDSAQVPPRKDSNKILLKNFVQVTTKFRQMSPKLS